MKTLAFVLAGVAAGIFSGSLGVGGALLATPLIRFLGVPPYLAVGTTVPAILPTTVTGAWSYGRAGLLDLRTAAWAAAAAGPAAVAGALSTHLVNGHVLMLSTAALLLVVGLRFLLDEETASPQALPKRSVARVLAVGTGAGFFSGLLGVGGGFLLVPTFIRWLGLPIKVAIGTSLAVIAFTSLPNLVAQALVGNVDWSVAGLLALGVVPGARAGSLLAIRARQPVLRIALVVGLGAVGLAYAGTELAALSSP